MQLTDCAGRDCEFGHCVAHVEEAGHETHGRVRQLSRDVLPLEAGRCLRRDPLATRIALQRGRPSAARRRRDARRQMPPSVAARPTARATKPGAPAGRDRRPTDAAQAPVSLLARASRGNAVRRGRVPACAREPPRESGVVDTHQTGWTLASPVPLGPSSDGECICRAPWKIAPSGSRGIAPSLG